jgi:hypothetical protein
MCGWAHSIDRVYVQNVYTNSRGRVPYTRHRLDFAVPLPASTVTKHAFPDKAALRECILEMRAKGMSYRQIAHEVGLHWTRVEQIVKSTSGNKIAR